MDFVFNWKQSVCFLSSFNFCRRCCRCHRLHHSRARHNKWANFALNENSWKHFTLTYWCRWRPTWRRTRKSFRYVAIHAKHWALLWLGVGHNNRVPLDHWPADARVFKNKKRSTKWIINAARRRWRKTCAAPFFLLCVATNYSLKEYNECSNKLIFSLVLIVCVFFLVFFFFCFRLLRMLLFLNAHSVCTTKTQFEQKKFLQQHKIRADSYSKAAATMKKQRKKKNNAQNADKEIKVSMNNLSGCAKCECTPQKNGDDGTMGDCAKLCLSSACAVHQRSLHSPA